MTDTSVLATRSETARYLHRAAGRLAGKPFPARLRAWDGSEAGEGGPLITLHNPHALRRMLWRPDDLGVARAYIDGDLGIEGAADDFMVAVIEAGDAALWDLLTGRVVPTLTRGIAALRLLGWAARRRALGTPPPRPESEAPWRGGADHYEMSNEFYRLVIGESMVYSTALWPDPEQPGDLDAAQRDKLELICRELRLRPGSRLLDIGSGWGALAVHAAQHHGARVLGVTLAAEQVSYATELAERAGVADRVEFRQCDFRDVRDGPFDAISSIEVSLHLNARALRGFSRRLHDLLAPGGRVFSQDVTTTRRGKLLENISGFLTAYVFPEVHIPTVPALRRSLTRAGLRIESYCDLTEHFIATDRTWLHNIETHWDAIVAEIGLPRARAERLFAATSVASMRTGLNQASYTIARRPGGGA
ncbi:class I SAM-dependent methyltransferase [Nocardia puris]|uniref:SAM-dependent methyltransferase n=1 Tax=Nocardia puris TaxID=208602 RepID=UPI00189407A4|nr:cyclopropane-fatty-acyl-phospholipid synthase family protein [Nocardia puris]MBF6212811.1 class I SAM-dependent methyltransferase [Nocardia puris]MBF6367746.1 class I SAM-dependent methyltransferase [Nocardia puris]MBF6461397.1 class I SAM-dependent methyltransferase [Nocardia puris]